MALSTPQQLLERNTSGGFVQADTRLYPNMDTPEVSGGTLKQDVTEMGKHVTVTLGKRGVSSQVGDGVVATEGVTGSEDSPSCHGCHVCFTSARARCDATVMHQQCRQCCSKTCTASNVRKKLPILTWLPKYRYCTVCVF